MNGWEHSKKETSYLKNPQWFGRIIKGKNFLSPDGIEKSLWKYKSKLLMINPGWNFMGLCLFVCFEGFDICF